MFDILDKTSIEKNKIRIIAYKSFDEDISNSLERKRSKDMFIYISSDGPHKNHTRLIEAWRLLLKDNISVKLILTIDKHTKLYRYINNEIKANGLKIEIRSNLKRNEIINLYYQSTALIYPSLFESYGLPLVEAKQYKLPVIASELDFVRDILDPEETFEPNSSKSIYRAVKRFLKIQDKKTDIVTPVDFINEVIDL